MGESHQSLAKKINVWCEERFEKFRFRDGLVRFRDGLARRGHYILPAFYAASQKRYGSNLRVE